MTIPQQLNQHHQPVFDYRTPRDGQSISSLEDALSFEDEDFVYANDAAAPSPVLSTTSLRDKQSWRTRSNRVFGWKRSIATPETWQYRGYLMSRMIHRYPFQIKAWYWFLIYWVRIIPRSSDTSIKQLFPDDKNLWTDESRHKVYQNARALGALRINHGVVQLAWDLALQLISLEQALHIFDEFSLQRAFVQYPSIIAYINAAYSYVHIPATILFLIALYHITITSTSTAASLHSSTALGYHPPQSLTDIALYQACRRTLATANLAAFIVFTT